MGQSPSLGMLVVFNPTEQEVSRELKVDLYYTGLTDTAAVSSVESDTRIVPIARDYTAIVPVSLPAKGFAWYLIE